ncbi:MAG: energy transducer TonB, partial [Pseudomonadota bacterium]
LDRPLMVNLIELAPPAPMPAEPPRPRAAAVPKPEQQPPILAAPMPTPTPMTASVAETIAQRQAVEPAATAPAAQAAAAPAPTTVVPPRFDADYLNNPAPAYPALSRRLGEQGQVLLRVYVEPDGSAARVEIKSGSGFERLDQAALTAVRKWRFVPARQAGAAVGAWVVVPIIFSLRS